MYKESDFNKCLFNPCVEDIFSTYPQLKKVKSVGTQIDNKLMKYIICVYDYRSPIVVHNRELKIRKQVAAEFSGYDVLNGNLKYLFNLEEDYIIQAIDTFLKSFIHSRVWYMICCNEQIFWEYGQRMLMPVGAIEEGGKKLSEKDLIAAMQAKTKLSEDMAAIDERLDAAYKRLYGNELIDKFLSGATTPERIAAERKQSNVQKN
jgi:hypothetical protein